MTLLSQIKFLGFRFFHIIRVILFICYKNAFHCFLPWDIKTVKVIDLAKVPSHSYNSDMEVCYILG